MLDETRCRVIASAQAIGYRRNALVRAMVFECSCLVALLMANPNYWTYPIVMDRLSCRQWGRGYHMLLFITELGGQDGMIKPVFQYQVQRANMRQNWYSVGAVQERGAGFACFPA
jgi:DNA-binding LacI/PurR family transcriptional regulator